MRSQLKFLARTVFHLLNPFALWKRVPLSLEERINRFSTTIGLTAGASSAILLIGGIALWAWMCHWVYVSGMSFAWGTVVVVSAYIYMVLQWFRLTKWWWAKLDAYAGKVKLRWQIDADAHASPNASDTHSIIE